MADHGYAYADAKNLFYTLSGTNSESSSALEGQMSVGDAVELLLNRAEMEVVGSLTDHYIDGKVPMLSGLQATASFMQTAGGSVTEWDLPPTDTDTNIFGYPISGYVKGFPFSGDRANPRCPISLIDPKDLNLVYRNSFFEPIAAKGGMPYDFVPAYIEEKKLKFFEAPYGTTVAGTPNIYLTYLRYPKFPTGTYSDIPKALMGMTVLYMLADFHSINADEFDLALSDERMNRAEKAYQEVKTTLGFNPFKWGSLDSIFQRGK